MIERQYRAKDEAKKKRDLILKKEQEEKEREERERNQKRRELLNKPVIKHDIDWKEFALLEDAKRKQRIEQRKQELLMSASLQDSLDGRSLYHKSKATPPPLPSHYKPFKATEDHETVCSTLLAFNAYH